MYAPLIEPTCKNCRWAKESKLPGNSGERSGNAIGMAVFDGPWRGFTMDGARYDALGVFYCEHQVRPRGLVLTNYVCRDHELLPEYDQDGNLKQVGGGLQIDGKPNS